MFLPGPAFPRCPNPAGEIPLLSTREGELVLLGLGLTVAGVAVEVGALVRFVRYGAEIERGGFTSSAPLYLLISTALVLLGVAFLGLAILS